MSEIRLFVVMRSLERSRLERGLRVDTKTWTESLNSDSLKSPYKLVEMDDIPLFRLEMLMFSAFFCAQPRLLMCQFAPVA